MKPRFCRSAWMSTWKTRLSQRDPVRCRKQLQEKLCTKGISATGTPFIPECGIGRIQGLMSVVPKSNRNETERYSRHLKVYCRVFICDDKLDMYASFVVFALIYEILGRCINTTYFYILRATKKYCGADVGFHNFFANFSGQNQHFGQSCCIYKLLIYQVFMTLKLLE